MFYDLKFFLLYIFFVFTITILLFIIFYRNQKSDNKKVKTTLIKKLYPNSKYLTSGVDQDVYINNNRIIKVYNQTNFNYVKLLRKLKIYPPIYKIIKDDNYYIVEEKYLKPIPGFFLLEKYGNDIFKKFKISFGDIKLGNYGIDPDTNKIHRLDCDKKDIYIKKTNSVICIELNLFIFVYLTLLLIIFTFIWKKYYNYKI